jgi:nucleotide-binding universal stress UspA family protein
MKILLATDGSTHSDMAVAAVAERPWPPGSVIRVLSAIQPYAPPATEVVLAGATIDDITRQQAARAEEITDRAADTLRRNGATVDTAVREGDARSVIVDEAKIWGADLIVVGSHGRRGLEKWLLGSVAQAVVAHAPCSVEVVRERPVSR